VQNVYVSYPRGLQNLHHLMTYPV